jgi:hypothetical protein
MTIYVRRGKKRDYSIRKLRMGHRHALGDGDGDGGNGGVSRCAAKATEERTRAEGKIETNRYGTHLGSITWWGEYDLIRSPTQPKHGFTYKYTSIVVEGMERVMRGRTTEYAP